ncbi:MAG TPA: hypothetical protein VE967_08070 [Gemmatimonadaceae bacterium]|nr:hypothetical protein [Gemmatimonadaceae bacterium]
MARNAAALTARTSDAFAVVAPGLEILAEREIGELGIANALAETGGVSFRAGEADLARVLIGSRIATRILVRAAQFRAVTFAELERHARSVRWTSWIAPRSTVRLRVTCKKSRLYHSNAVAQRVADALTAAIPGVRALEGAGTDDDGEGDSQLIVVRVSENICTIRIDAAGDPLYKRGYRQAVAKAPLRETLAAAMLAGARWSGDRALYDPMCGSGTIVIEAALMARRMAPGLHRAFAAERWPGARADVWKQARETFGAAVLGRAACPLAGSDRDAGAVRAAQENAARAGVASDVSFSVGSVSAADPSHAHGLLVTNPPYGTRVGDTRTLRDLYASLGTMARARCPAWSFAMLSADRSRGHTLERQIGFDTHEVWRSTNGGIPVRLVSGTVPPR